MSVYTKRLSVVFLFIINIVTGQDVCPPNNFSAEAGVAEVHLNWENPGIYYGIHEVSPKDSAYYTGSVDNVSGSFTDTSKIISIDQEVGWATFDISALPAGQEPLSVDFNFYVYETSWPYWAVTPVSSNPLTTGASDLYGDIVAGAGSDGVSDYGTFREEENFAPGPHTRSLVGDIFADITNAADTTDWFTIGVVDWDFSTIYYIKLEGWNEAHPPYLTVTYGEGTRYIVPSVPFPGVSNEEVLAYKTEVVNGTAEPMPAQHPQVEISFNSAGNRDDDECDGAWAYYVYMDGSLIDYTSATHLTVENLVIDQEYCFTAKSQYLDTNADGETDTLYSGYTDTLCVSPVAQLLCPTANFTSISTYTELNLNWAAPFAPGSVEAWGWFWDNPTGVPEIESVTKIAAGYSHTLVLKSDSTVSNWPTGGYLQIPGNENHDFIDIAAGWFFNIGLRSDGTMLGWWYSEEGQGEPPDSITDAVAVAAGYNHAMALRSDSTVVAWGNNTYGETDVPAGLNNVIQIDAGNYYSAALKSDGTVVAWGNNNLGETQVPADLTDVVEISCGSEHMLALKSDGSIVAWGSNFSGQTNIPANLGEVEKIAAGGYHNMVLNTNGELIGWGSNSNGQTDLPEVFEDVTQIACGGNFTALLLAETGEECGTLNGYTVYEGGDSIAFTTASNYAVTTLEWGEEACYNIAANYNEGYSTWSDTICSSLITPAFCGIDTLHAESDYDMIYLEWPQHTGNLCGSFIGYKIYQDGNPIDTVSLSEYELPDLEYDTEYCYTVSALYEEGESISTDVVCLSLVTPQLCLPDSFTVVPGDTSVFIDWLSILDSADVPPAPPAPQSNIQKAFGNTSGLIDISNVSDPETRSLLEVDGCGIFLGYTIFQNGDTLAFITDTTSLSITGLENGVEYCFSISAAYEQGSSPISDEICVMPFAALREHDTGIVQTSITNEGNIGFTDWAMIDDSTAGNGVGFVYSGNNYLFESGLMVGTGQGQISDCIRNELGGLEEDFVEEEGTSMHINEPGELTYQEGLVILNDSGAEDPLGIRIVQKSYADLIYETRNGVIFHYTLVNESNADLAGLYSGLFFDWDVMDYNLNVANYNADHQMVYVQDQEENPAHFVGSMLMNVGLGANIDALYNASDGVYQYSNAFKWTHMTGGINEESASNADVSTYAGIGPVDISAGDSISFGIAVFAASSIYELEYVAGELRGFWDTHFPEELGNENEAIFPNVFALHQNYPNPFNPATSIRYDIPVMSNVQVDVYSLLGQKVKTLVRGAHQPGFHAVQWNGTNDMGSPVASGMYICRIQADRFSAVKKLILMK